MADTLCSTVLTIDLTTKTYAVHHRPELFTAGMGGTSAGIHLLNELCPAQCDPLGAENPIIFSVGSFTSLFPMTSKTVAMFTSPLTGELGESHCGGRSAVAIRMAGYGAIVITGASDIPVYVVIDGKNVFFRNASTLWGMSNNTTAGKIIRQREGGSGIRTIMRIGKAGEACVRYACVTTETFRHFGRLGLGAVFGSKKLKAVVISGTSSIDIPDFKGYRVLYDELYKAAVSSPVMKKYHELGTAENVLPLNKIGGLPVRNLTANRMDNAENISGETLAEHFLGRRLACAHCPVACIHVAALREPYEDEPYFYKTTMVSYDHELIYAAGSMLGVTKAEGLLKLLDAIESWGMDIMSAGVVLAWMTEAFEKKLITEKETLNLKPEWGNVEEYIRITAHIVDQPNDFYAACAQGVYTVASKFGGIDFALQFGKNEMPGYHAGPATHIGYAAGLRHSHLDNAGYSLDQKMLNDGVYTPDSLAEKIITEESWRQVLSSLTVCFFARNLYTAEMLVRMSAVLGITTTTEELITFGTSIYREKLRFKKRHGWSLDTESLPKRIFETDSPHGKIDKDYMEKTIAAINRLHDKILT